mgnify:CR=1 FL=1
MWSMSTGILVKRLNAHFQRIVEIKSLVVGSENSVLTSSIDRSIKVSNFHTIRNKYHYKSLLQANKTICWMKYICAMF